MILNYEEDYFDPDDNRDFSDFDTYEDETREKFAKDMFDFLTDIMKQDNAVNEMFTSDKNAQKSE